jgi:hypothetical protein
VDLGWIPHDDFPLVSTTCPFSGTRPLPSLGNLQLHFLLQSPSAVSWKARKWLSPAWATPCIYGRWSLSQHSLTRTPLRPTSVIAAITHGRTAWPVFSMLASSRKICPAELGCPALGQDDHPNVRRCQVSEAGAACAIPDSYHCAGCTSLIGQRYRDGTASSDPGSARILVCPRTRRTTSYATATRVPGCRGRGPRGSRLGLGHCSGCTSADSNAHAIRGRDLVVGKWSRVKNAIISIW